MTFIKTKLIRDILRYIFFLSLFLRVLLSIYIGYQYVWVSSSQISTKWGTFVEGIFGNTSYLPYLRNDTQSTFYQGLLFNACVRPSYDKQAATYVPDLCSVTTQDNRSYSIKLNKWFIRSDGTPLSLEDIYFTYNEIIRNNKRNLSLLSPYKDITILKDVNNTLTVTFTTASPENIQFFTNYILPKHMLINSELNDYTSIFAFKPVYTNCANLVSQSTDAYSLVFNLVNCNQTNLNFYQVKNMVSFDTFKADIQKWYDSIIDAYIGDETLRGYENKQLITDQLMTIFFNTRSDKLRVRGRRALWGLIKRNFYSSGYETYVQKNIDGLFDVFQSTGTDIKNLLNREYNENIITKEDLMDINVQPLPRSIAIKGTNQKFVYFIETGASLSTELLFDQGYDKITIEYKGKTDAPKHFVKWGKSWWYVFGIKEWNIGTGLNKFSIYGYNKSKKILLSSVDIYNMLTENIEEEASVVPVKLTVVYYQNHLNNFVVERLQQIFAQADIQDNFVFEAIATTQELQGRLMVGDYDLLINTVDMGIKQDLTKLFSTDKSEINPSQYQNQKLTSLLQQYSAASEKGKKKPLVEINSIYSKDMPFVILGREYLNLHFKPSVVDKLFGTGDVGALIDEYTRRNYVYKQLKLVTNIHIDGKKIWNLNNFWDFLTKAIR